MWIDHPATESPVGLIRWLKYHLGVWMQTTGHRWEIEALHPDRLCDGCGQLRRIGNHKHCDEIPF